LGELFAETGRPKDAEAAYNDALVVKQQLVDESPKVTEYQNDLANGLNNLAELVRTRKDLHTAKQLYEKALAHSGVARKGYPDHPQYRRILRDIRIGLAQTLVELGDHAAAAAAAELLVQLAVDPANDLYNAARLLARCVSPAAKDSRLPEPQRLELAGNYTKRAMSYLLGAVEKGFRDHELMTRDGDLDALRSRDDFKKLVLELRPQSKAVAK
jgi:tetratricopeptide (TPR) repeat protein